MFLNTSNVCQFEGRVAKDPQFSQIQGTNGPVDKVVFDIAVDRSMSSAQKQAAQAQNKPTADFIHCQMLGTNVANFRQWCPKGKAIKVICHYEQYTSTDKNTGQTTYGHQFICDAFGFTVADAKAISGGTNNGNFQQYNNQPQGNYPQQQPNYQQPQQAPQPNFQPQQPQPNFMNAPQPQQSGNFQMFDSSNSASPF